MKGYKVLSIKPEETYEWLKYKHYAKRIPSISYSYGLYKKNELVGVLTIGKPASNSLCIGVCGEENSEYVYELNRLCVNDGLERNTLSFFVGCVLRRINNTENMILVSYSDTGMNHVGYIYQATNWIYTGETKPRTDMASPTGGHSRHGNDPSKRQYRTAKHRYVQFLGRKKKYFEKNLKYIIQQYPKGDTKKYDATHKPQTQALLDI
jgi:hypothetical protein